MSGRPPARKREAARLYMLFQRRLGSSSADPEAREKTKGKLRSKGWLMPPGTGSKVLRRGS